MRSLLLGLSPEYLYFRQGCIEQISQYHRPYFLAFTSNSNKNTAAAQKDLIDIWQKNKDGSTPLSYITKIGDLETYRSFCDFKKTFEAFKVYTSESYRVPEVSDHLFFNYGFYTGEHDIPYQQRALVDLSASGKTWLFDSNGKKEHLDMLVYDIELTHFEPGKLDSPIDIIGYAKADISFQSSKNLFDESFQFDILDIPSGVDEKDIVQLVARSIDEEIDILSTFCKLVKEHDIISGHNIIGFDNRQIHGRIQTLLKQNRSQFSPTEKELFETFLSRYSRLDRSFHFGINSDVIQIYPCSFDTYLASRKFYPFLDSHSLKAVAPFLGITIPNRLILGPSEIKLDARTMKYNRHDILEQMGITLHLIQQTLPLSFTTGMPFDMLLDSGAVNMWDHMSLIRGAFQKKLIPATCRVTSIAQNLIRDFNGCNSKEDIVSMAKDQREQLSKDLIRVIKYGSEMPDWMLYPYVIFNDRAEDVEDQLNYHMPGGMTIKPDKDVSSHFIPWYNVIVADVGAMYPTILKALNVGADTVCLCPKHETPDAWIWLKKIPTMFFEKQDVVWRKISEEESYADKGYMIGVKIDKRPGVVNCAMTGIMSMIARIKKELKQASAQEKTDGLSRLKMMYQSVKGARNAGTHGILAAPNVSGRQFNLWAAATITTKGQIILNETLNDLEKKKIRVVYGDSVDAETDIIIREKGFVKIVKISDLFEKTNSQIMNQNQHEYKEIRDSIECLSVNPQGSTEWKKILFIKRHPFKDKILNIHTQRGSISVTKNHSLYTYINELKPIFCKDLVEDDDSIVHISRLKKQNIHEYKTVNALDPLIPFDESLNIWLNIPLTPKTKHLLRHHQPRNNYKGGKGRKKSIRMNIKTAIELFRKNVILNEDLESSFISSYNGKGKIPVIFEFDEDFARLVGAYTAEGSLYFRKRHGMTKEGGHIFVCGHHKKNLSNLQKIAERLFKRKCMITPSGMDKNGLNYRIQGTSTTAYLFYHVMDCGLKSNCKKVSPFVLSSKNSVREAFLEEYINGDGYYDTRNRINPLLEITSRSKQVIEGSSLLSILLKKGLPSVDYREEKKAYRLRVVQYNKGSHDINEISLLKIKKIREQMPTDGHVYDMSVEDNNNFVSALGLIVAHNTDGVYMGCSNSVKTIPRFSKALGVTFNEPSTKWLTSPQDAVAAIEACNVRWQKQLSYAEFELEPEFHDAMIFVKHKNYLIFDEKKGKVEMATKGNNFKGSDKANIARKTLKDIMLKVLKENTEWTDEEKARTAVKESIMRITKEVVATLDLSKVDIADLTLIQQVKPANKYKRNQDGSMSTFGKRSDALEKVLGESLHSGGKFKFVVTKHPLPGISNPSKSGVKPIDYMYPIDKIHDAHDIDLDWYKQMIENYIQGAFGLSQMQKTEQTGLDAWM
jgi:DNA polymerase elongation subunit (family B)/intein/homing endonuclease